jgi:hypothetical protein
MPSGICGFQPKTSAESAAAITMESRKLGGKMKLVRAVRITSPIRSGMLSSTINFPLQKYLPIAA